MARSSDTTRSARRSWPAMSPRRSSASDCTRAALSREANSAWSRSRSGTWRPAEGLTSRGRAMSQATASEPRGTGIYWAAAPNDVKLVLTRGIEVPIDAAELVRAVAPEFRGKGGGKPDFAQASFPNLDMARVAAAKLEELIRKKLGIESG